MGQPYEILFMWCLLYVRECREVFFTCSDLDDAVYVVNEDLTVTDVTCVKRLLGCFDYLVYRNRGYDNFDLDLR